MADWTMFPIVLIGAYALIFKVPKDRRLAAYSRILVAGLTAYLLSHLIATVYQPDTLRPFELLGKVAGASYLNNAGFPSDHVLFVTALTCAVWFETKQKWLTLIMTLLIVIVGIGRVLALVHTPVDVIGGAVIGLMGSIWYLNSKR